MKLNFLVSRINIEFTQYFTVNNSGNQTVKLIQAIPYDFQENKKARLALLENGNCKTFTDSTIGATEIKDFNVDVFVDKNTFHYMKQFEANSPLKGKRIYDQNGKIIEPSSSYMSFDVELDVFTYSADRKRRKSSSERIKLRYEEIQETIAT